MTAEKQAITKLQKNPVLHIEEIQGVESLEPFQKDVVNAIAKYDRIAVSACHCVGKTFTLSKIVLALGSSFKGAKIVTTAPTFVQVEKLLWSEIRAGFRDSRIPLGGEMLQTEWKIAEDWFAIGLSPKDDTDGGDGQGKGSRFQGIHGDLVVIVFDEATGVHTKRWIQAEGMLTSAHVKFVAVGNPTTRNCEFYRCFQSPLFKTIKITCFDSPNLKANKITNKDALAREIAICRELTQEARLQRIKNYKVTQPKLLTLQWVISMGLKWGIDHPLFVSKCLGEFPEEDERALVKLIDVETAMDRDASIDDMTMRAIGVDPARFGSDSTVITIIDGRNQTLRKEIMKADTSEVTGVVVDLINNLPRRQRETVVIDGTGIGSGVVDQLKERRSQKIIPNSIIIREVHFGAACPVEKDKMHYFNLKAKIFALLSEDLKNVLSILNESVYLGELPSIIYKFDSRGRMVIESKDEYKKRTGLGSPDSADSLALANYGRHNVRSVGTFTESMNSQENSSGTGTLTGDLLGNGW
jgi:hypothetical protein